LEAGASSTLTTLRRNARVNRHGSISRRRPNTVVHSNPTIQHVLQSIDSFVGRSVGVALRRYPLARIALVAYIVLLHLWVLVILIHFIHHDNYTTNAVGGGQAMTTMELPDEPAEMPLVKSVFGAKTGAGG
jgi:hypothetical protein